jgi:hypothetical protein
LAEDVLKQIPKGSYTKMGIPRVGIRERDIPVFPSLGMMSIDNINELDTSAGKAEAGALTEALTVYKFSRLVGRRPIERGKGGKGKK